MSVRRRLLGSCATFFAAVALVGSAQGQPPFQPFPMPPPAPGGRELSPDQVKSRIESFLNRGKPGGQLPPGMDLEKLAELMKQLGIRPGQNPKLDPEQLESLKKQFDANPELRKKLEGMRPKGDNFPPNEKGPRPFDPGFKNDDRKFGPGDLKIEPKAKRTPPEFDPQSRPPGPEPKEFGKGDPPPPPVGRGDPPPQFPPPARELPPWEQPESPQDKARQAAAAMWEKNVGPLDETPAVKKALFELAEGTGDLKDPDGNSLWDSLSKEFGDGKSLGDLFDGVDAGDGWKMGDWEFPKLNWNFNWGNNRMPDVGGGGGERASRESWWSRWRRSSSPSSPSSSSGSSWFSGWKAPKWNIGIPALDGTWLPVVFVVAALVGGFFLWRWLARRGAGDSTRIDPYALGPWPVDPHRLASRKDVVIAFEHLSVLICGPVAKTWTHTTIAGALSELAMAEPARAMMLARLYELARYTPIDEPLTTAELAEARILVCRLAGFSDD